jgi:hypothetical protein
MKKQSKDGLQKQFDSFKQLNETEKTMLLGGQRPPAGNETAPCGYETAGDPNTYVDTTSGGGDCGADPEHEDNPCV